MQEKIITKHYHLIGQVQGVWCRDFVVKEATSRGIKGWVKNLSDGRVEIMAQATKEALDALEACLHVGSPLATVEKVEGEMIEEHGDVYIDFKQVEVL